MESNTLFVFHNPGAEPDDGFAARLGEYGTAVRILPSVWQVRSDKTGLQLFDALRRRIAGNDQLLVIDTTADAFHCVPEPQAGVVGGPTS